MFKDEFKATCNAGLTKLNLLKNNPVGYFFSAMLAGMFVAIGAFACFAAATPFKDIDSPATKVIMAAVFAVALSLVIAAGSELFTGNCFVLTAATLGKTITWGDNLRISIVAYLGNFIGTLIFVAMFQLSGVPRGPIGEFFVASSAIKMAYPPIELLVRGIFCNILVCLAVWCSIKLKSETAKLIMAFWCIFAFMICGFEHSIANMSILAVGLLNAGGEAVSIGGYFYNLLLSTVGNIIGGVLFVALPYYMISRETS